MKIETKNLKVLKTFDDTAIRGRKKKNQTNKLTAKPKIKKQSKKNLKILPGQQFLSFTSNIMKGRNKTFEFLCVDQRTMGWPDHLTSQIISHNYDNDQQSNEHVVKKEVQKGIASLVQEITFKKIMEMEDTIGF